MNIKLVGIFDRGNLDKERIHFIALSDLSLSYYAVFSTFYTGQNQIQALDKNCYWFPPKNIRANENIVLYTKAGQTLEQKKENGDVHHFYYRGLRVPVFQNPNACAVIFELKTWITEPKAMPG